MALLWLPWLSMHCMFAQADRKTHGSDTYAASPTSSLSSPSSSLSAASPQSTASVRLTLPPFRPSSHQSNVPSPLPLPMLLANPSNTLRPPSAFLRPSALYLSVPLRPPNPNSLPHLAALNPFRILRCNTPIIICAARTKRPTQYRLANTLSLRNPSTPASS